MSHLPERKEKDCLNCGAVLHGLYCHVCGQENYEPKESAWGLIGHFFKDITHFDGKFFSSLRLLITRPGFLSLEYMRGRRASYLNPIRMYIFTSAVFFLIFFSVGSDESEAFIKFSDKTPVTQAQKDKTPKDSVAGNKHEDADSAFIITSEKKFNTKEAYDSFQRTLPDSMRHNWFERYLVLKEIQLKGKYGSNSKTMLYAFKDKFAHSIPQMLFFSLPLIALLLKLLYIRRKQYYYTDHAIFIIHFYIFVFIALLFNMSFEQLDRATGWGIFAFFKLLVWFGLFFYLYKAMRHFYQQRRAKTILKFVLFILGADFIVALLALLFIFISFYKM